MSSIPWRVVTASGLDPLTREAGPAHTDGSTHGSMAAVPIARPHRTRLAQGGRPQSPGRLGIRQACEWSPRCSSLPSQDRVVWERFGMPPFQTALVGVVDHPNPDRSLRQRWLAWLCRAVLAILVVELSWWIGSVVAARGLCRGRRRRPRQDRAPGAISYPGETPSWLEGNGYMARLSPEQVEAALVELPGWRREADALVKEFRFKTFREAIAFVNEVAELARRLRHHPQIVIDYNRVRLSLTTHDEGGITEKDVQFARQVASSEPPQGSSASV